MKKSFLFIFFCIALSITQGQTNFSLHGKLRDSLNKNELSNATVSIINASDSSLIAFTRADSLGQFLFSRINKGNYFLSASHVNFHTKWVAFQISGAVASLKLPDIIMVDNTILQAININAKRAPVVVNGDTLEFNAEGFKTKPNAVVEDMLKKMPGVEVAKDGTVTVNGKKISRVLVNGKDFFNGDPTIATRNLSADAVDKVQVFDKQSDQSAFTGIDDGNSQKTLNLKLKKNKMNALFGKTSLAEGSDSRYEGKFNLNKFKGEQQLSSIGMSNNTNQQGFALMDVMNFTGENKKMMRGGGGIIVNTTGPQTGGVPVAGMNSNAQGITTTTAGGINFNDNWKKRTDINSSYFYNYLDTRNQRNVYRQSQVQGNQQNYSEQDDSRNQNTSNRINISLDQSIDTFNSVKLVSTFADQTALSSSNNNFYTLNGKVDSTNRGSSVNSSNSNGTDFQNNLLLKHKFSKKGRTISVNVVTEINNSAYIALTNSITAFFINAGSPHADTLDQNNNVKSVTQSYGVNVTYTEPLSKKALLEFHGFYNYGSGRLTKNTYDRNSFTGKYDLINQKLSNNYFNNYNTVGGGIALRGLKKKLTYNVGVNLESDALVSAIVDSSFNITHSKISALPIASFTYNFTRMKNLRFIYNTTVTQPTTSQLQPVKDLSDPLNIKEGNPLIDQSYTHSLALQYFSANPGKQNNLIAFANFSLTNNAIVNSDILNASGQRLTKPVNTDGVYSLFGVIERGFRVKALSTHFGTGLNVSYNHNINFINNQREETNNLGYTPKFTADYNYKEILNLTFASRFNFNDVHYQQEKQLNNKYLKQLYNFETTITPGADISMSSDLTYTINSGRTDGYNQNTAIWNASIAKQILKSKKGELKLSVYNLLNQNIGVDRNSNFTYIEDVRYTTLKRYVTFGFTYNLQKPVSGGPKMVIRNF